MSAYLKFSTKHTFNKALYTIITYTVRLNEDRVNFVRYLECRSNAILLICLKRPKYYLGPFVLQRSCIRESLGFSVL